MTDRAQFEAMLEALINDDQEQAKEIFHNIVVGKSREIYEELLESDFSQDSGNPYGKKDDEEGTNEDSMEEENADLEEDDEEEEEGYEEEEGADDEESDDEEGDDSEEPDFGADDEEGEEGGDMEDRVMDLEDALEDLKAEFEQLLAGEEHEEHDNPDIHGGELDGLPGMGGDHDMEADEAMFEYVNRVPSPKHGDNGTNTRSTIDNMKNDMGGTVKNIAQSHSEVKGDAGVKAGGTKGGLLKPTTADLTAGLDVHNRPGSDAGKKAFKKQVEGGGLDRQNSFKAKGQLAGAKSGEVGGQRGEQNTKATIGKRVR